MTKQINLNFQVDIKEQGFLNGDFIIQGTAISSNITSNNHKFLSEELQKSAPSLKGVPLLKDHNNTIDSIVGRVVSGEFNQLETKIDFKAKVIDEDAKQLIKDGRLNTVSVGAIVDDIEEEDGVFIPRGITFKELSLVAVPADSAATFQIALKEAYNSKGNVSDYTESEKDFKKRAKKLRKQGDININTKEVKQMSEEQNEETTPEAEATKEEAKEEAPAEDEAKAEPEAEAEPEVTEEKVKSMIAEAIKAKEADADEAKPEAEPEAKSEPKPEAKAEDDDEDEEEEVAEEKFKIEQSYGSLRGGSFSLVR